MSLSEKISGDTPRVSSWHGEYRSQKKIKLLGELSIICGLMIVGFGIFTTEAVDAKSISALPQVEPPPSIDLSSLSGFHADVTPYKPLELDRSVVDSKMLGLFKSPAEADTTQAKIGHLAFEPKGDELYRKGGRVKAGYLLPKSEIEWFEEKFIISHYTFALESDPLYTDDEKIVVPGLPEEDKFRSGFIFGGRGVLLQGTGLTEDGRYISIDWPKSHHDPEDVSNNRWVFKYGVGRPVIPWETVAVRHPELPPGTRIVVENYLGQYEFIVGDNGLDLAENQIDIFVGTMTIGEADQLGVQRSRVGIIKPVYHYDPFAESAEVTADGQPETDNGSDG